MISRNGGQYPVSGAKLSPGDPDDRKFAALSAAAKRPLVTNDNHLLADRNIIGIDALTPRAFLAREGEDT